MSTYEAELEGREFDWYAIDNEGNLALFSTAGEGLIPAMVIDNYQIHDDVSEAIEAPNWGSSEVWSDYASLGMYVFDWDLPGGPYQRERVPTKDMSQELKQKILKAAVKLDVSFSQTETINRV